MPTVKRIRLQEARTLPANTTIYDAELKGFLARRQRSEAVTFFVRYRTAANVQRTHKIGRFGSLTAEKAREEAKKILADVLQGKDPASDRRAAREAPDVAELCDLYLVAAESGRLLTKRRAPKRASTIRDDRSRLEGHVKPLIGKLKVAAVTTRQL